MDDYIVFFEIYGKKLKTTVQATDEMQAMDIVKSSITVIKVTKTPPPSQKSEKQQKNDFGDVENFFENLLDIINKKK